MNFKKIVSELKRRNVFKVATAYAITGWLIIQIVTSIKEPLALPNWFDTAIIIFVLIGFPISLLFAWAFEMTPEGLKKTVKVDEDKSVTKATGKKLNRIIISVLSLFIIFLLVDKVFNFTSTTTKTETTIASLPSIAVLPFEDFSPKNDQEYFSDGLSEELLNVLAKVKEINVAGRNSSFKFKGKHEDLKIVGKQLGVDHILEGSVRKSGNKIRITAQLIKVSDGFHMWSETYDKEYSADNLFKIQDEISKKILQELKIKLSLKEEQAEATILTSNTEAYEAFLKGNQLLVNRNPQEIIQAVDEFKKAIRLDSKFALAYAKLAIAYYHAINYAGFDTKKGNEEVKNNADYALLLDNTLGEAYAALGHYYTDRDKAKIALKRAYELEPNNAEILMWYSKMFAITDHKGLELLLKAYKIDPLSPIVVNNLAQEYRFKDNFEKATYYFKLNIKNNPDYVASKIALIDMLGNSPNGKLDEAFIESYKAYKLKPKNLELLENIFRKSLSINLNKFAKSIADSILKNYPDNIQNQFFDVQIAMQSNNISKAKQAFSKMVEAQLIFDDSWQNKARVNGYKKLMNQDYNDALNAYIKIYPKAISDTISVITDNEMHDFFPEIITMLEGAGKAKQSEKITKLYFATIKKSFEHEGNIKKEKAVILNLLQLYYAATNDAKNYVEIKEELYFGRKEKLYETSLDPNLVVISSPILNNPIYKTLRKKIDEDINKMQTNAINFLKTEGVWEKYKE